MMSIGQVIAMLTAAQSQGAQYVMLASRDAHGNSECAYVDWISPAPVDGIAYISPMAEREVLGNEAAESIDW